jgi:signal transduction histidine kinase
MNKAHFSIRTTLLLIISVLNLLIAALIGNVIFHSWERLDHARALTRASATINFLYRTEKYLSLERAASMSVMYVSSETAQSLLNDIAVDRGEADSVLNQGLVRIKGFPVSAEAVSLEAEVEEEYKVLQNLRSELDSAMKKPLKDRDSKLPDRMFASSTALIMKIRDLTLTYIRPLQTIDAMINRQIMFKHAVWEITEYAGREYAVIGRLIAEEKPITREVQENLLGWRTLIEHGWETAQQLVIGSGLDQKLAPYINEAQTHYFMTFGQIKDIFYTAPSAPSATPYPLSTEMWLVLSSEAVDSLLTLKDASLHETQDYVDKMEQGAEREIFISLLVFACVTLISLYCFAIIIWRVIRPVNAMVDALYKTSLGIPHDPLPYLQRNDEIGKLASVLEVFEDNIRTIKQSNEELERYAYITAHDLKSPLRAIDNLSQWIEEDLGDVLTGKAGEHMGILRKRVRRMEKLLNDTLEYSRIGKQLQSMSNEIINGQILLEDAIAMAAPPPGFMIKSSDEFLGMKIGRTPLQQVFYNLINNSIKHHDKNTGTIEINVKEGPVYYIFSVSDDGPGIPAEYHEKVFEMFQTLKPRDQREGSGMGLAIVRKILTVCGGEIKLVSESGHGATFNFTWPKINEEKKDGRQLYI